MKPIKPTLTIKDLRRQYAAAVINPDRPVDYAAWIRLTGLAIQSEYSLTGVQRDYIMEKAYIEYYNEFESIFYGAAWLAEFVIKFPKN